MYMVRIAMKQRLFNIRNGGGHFGPLVIFRRLLKNEGEQHNQTWHTF